MPAKIFRAARPLEKTKMDKQVQQLRALIEEDLKKRLAGSDTYAQKLWQAMQYSVMAGGKRLRPVMLMLTGLSLGAPQQRLLAFASGLEMIHTYSLIHDDLPAMDNDDYRRGRLTNHKVYGQAAAILAGDGLLNLGLETMAGQADQETGEGQRCCVKALSYIASCSGPSGMVAGQMADLLSEGRTVSLEELTYIEFQKTSRLLMAAVAGGAVLSGADPETVSVLEQAAGKLGLAFQIQDDVLDVTGTLETLGKMPDSDEKTAKSTFVSLYGLDRAMDKSQELTLQAVKALEILPGEYGQSLRSLAASLTTRKS